MPRQHQRLPVAVRRALDKAAIHPFSLLGTNPTFVDQNTKRGHQWLRVQSKKCLPDCPTWVLHTYEKALPFENWNRFERCDDSRDVVLRDLAACVRRDDEDETELLIAVAENAQSNRPFGGIAKLEASIRSP